MFAGSYSALPTISFPPIFVSACTPTTAEGFILYVTIIVSLVDGAPDTVLTPTWNFSFVPNVQLPLSEETDEGVYEFIQLGRFTASIVGFG